MASVQDYSVFSAFIYGEVSDEIIAKFNETLLPNGWTKLPDNGVGATSTAVPSGLFASAFKNDNEIVIAYEGNDFSMRESTGQTIEAWLVDGNLSVDIKSTPLFHAALFYQQVKAQYPNTEITFTGHAMGAELASIMSVWFNRPSTTFTNAPFLSTEINTIFAAETAELLQALGFTDAQFFGYILRNLVNETVDADIS